MRPLETTSRPAPDALGEPAMISDDLAEGLAGLQDRAKPGRPTEIDELDIVNATLRRPPEELEYLFQ